LIGERAHCRSPFRHRVIGRIDVAAANTNSVSDRPIYFRIAITMASAPLEQKFERRKVCANRHIGFFSIRLSDSGLNPFSQLFPFLLMMRRRSAGISPLVAASERAELYFAAHPGSPAAVRRPKFFQRSGTWVALLGPSVRKGIAGFGITIESALRAFDAQYLAALRPPATRWDGESKPGLHEAGAYNIAKAGRSISTS